MAITLMSLPFAADALEPYMSARTLGFHHGKHHAAYVAKTNDLIKGTELENATLDEILKQVTGKAEKQALFNNAAQVWNHDFFWNSLAKNGGSQPPEPIAKRFERDFGSFQNFRKAFVDKAVAQFGSGWAWLVSKNGKLDIVTTGNANRPDIAQMTPLMTCDVWEHAYYLDYQNERAKFVQAILDNVINWQWLGKQLVTAEQQHAA
jgi:Fe-Mn family superoxide dismutase